MWIQTYPFDQHRLEATLGSIESRVADEGSASIWAGTVETSTFRGGHSRREWSAAEKSRIVAETREPGVSVAAAARRNGVHVSQVYAWMRDPRLSARTDKPINAFMAVDVADDAHAEPADEQNPLGDRAAQPSLSRIEIETTCGARVRCDCAFDEDALVRVLSALKRAT